jgi:hypothetical protein
MFGTGKERRNRSLPFVVPNSFFGYSDSVWSPGMRRRNRRTLS